MSVYQLNVEGINDMTKSTKQTDAPKSTKKTDVKGKAAGLYSLAVALTELASTYVFVTQDNKILLPLAVVLGVDCAQRFARAFLRAV